MAENSNFEKTTILATTSINPSGNHGIPNPPIYRASTILSERMAQYRGEEPSEFDYGRVGTPTSQAFEQAICALYEADDAISTHQGYLR